MVIGHQSLHVELSLLNDVPCQMLNQQLIQKDPQKIEVHQIQTSREFLNYYYNSVLINGEMSNEHGKPAIRL